MGNNPSSSVSGTSFMTDEENLSDDDEISNILHDCSYEPSILTLKNIVDSHEDILSLGNQAYKSHRSRTPVSLYSMTRSMINPAKRSASMHTKKRSLYSEKQTFNMVKNPSRLAEPLYYESSVPIQRSASTVFQNINYPENYSLPSYEPIAQQTRKRSMSTNFQNRIPIEQSPIVHDTYWNSALPAYSAPLTPLKRASSLVVQNRVPTYPQYLIPPAPIANNVSIAKPTLTNYYSNQYETTPYETMTPYLDMMPVIQPQARVEPINVPLNIDPNPEIITRKPEQTVNYTQNIALKFLKPPLPPQPGDITIRVERDIQAPPAPPLLIRQKPPVPLKPPTLIFREQPPKPPAPIAPQFFTLPGKVFPPPPRKLIVERFPRLPQPPQDIIIERWLSYMPRTRRVLFEAAPRFEPAPAPKNLIIQWAPPDALVHREHRFLGTSPASPSQYVAHFGVMLTPAVKLPQVVYQFSTPPGEVLGAQYRPDVPKLVGDIWALKLVDLDAAGLSEYKALLN